MTGRQPHDLVFGQYAVGYRFDERPDPISREPRVRRGEHDDRGGCQRFCLGAALHDKNAIRVARDPPHAGRSAGALGTRRVG